MFKIKSCFVICPFGAPDSPERKRSDEVLEVIQEATAAEGFEAFRSIDIRGSKPGLISANVIDKLCTADLIVADLTGSNANVYYEFALRHATGKPFIVLAENPSELKFDVHDLNAIPLQYKKSKAKARDMTVQRIRSQIQEVQNGEGQIETPISKKFLRQTKAFDWTIMYVKDLAGSWLKRQTPACRSAVKAYLAGKPVPKIYRNKVAQYAEFRNFQDSEHDAMLFHHTPSESGQPKSFVIFGSIAIETKFKDKPEGVRVIQFVQPERTVKFLGARETIPAFKYSVDFIGQDKVSRGVLYHPDYQKPRLKIATTELRLL